SLPILVVGFFLFATGLVLLYSQEECSGGSLFKSCHDDLIIAVCFRDEQQAGVGAFAAVIVLRDHLAGGILDQQVGFEITTGQVNEVARAGLELVRKGLVILSLEQRFGLGQFALELVRLSHFGQLLELVVNQQFLFRPVERRSHCRGSWRVV